MSLTPGARIGHYEVVSLLGAGGMGEVYRARDTKLNRDVALKVLPASVAADAERLSRFRREAQVLAALNHQNIAHVHGFEDSGDTHALVMELVEGPTLADRIGPNGIPLAEALPIAKQIAEALEAAHEQGIVHRDLKPANVKVREDGVVKVLDFGLAKALSTDPSGISGADPMNSPTLTARSTQLGMIIGTAAYMSPEQAKGRQVDRRADIWAFGVVLYEMVTGRRGYEAEDISETLAAVLTREVDWKSLPSNTPARLKSLIRDCLVRDPRERLRDIGDARRELQRLISGEADSPAAVAASAPAAAGAGGRLAWIVAALAVVAAAVSGYFALRPVDAQAVRVTRSQTHLKDYSGFIAISNDGTKSAYAVAGGSNAIYIAVRLHDQFAAKAVAGTEGGAWPLFSPDGQSIAFSEVSGPKIKRVSLNGGTPTTIGDGSLANGASWGPDDTIVFAGAKGLMKIPANGGTPVELTKLDAGKGETAHSRPQHLPGGRQILFTLHSKEGLDAAILDLGTGTYQKVAKAGINTRYVASGHLLYQRERTLYAVPFDLKSLTVAGNEVPVIEGVSQGPSGTGDLAVGDDGTVVYFASLDNGQGTTLAWSDRAGTTTPLTGQATGQWGTGRLSPDGRFVANVLSNSNGGRDVWVFDVSRGTPTRLTINGAFDYPVWTSDGKRLYFGGAIDGKVGVYRVPVDGSARAEFLFGTQVQVQINSTAPDGRSIVYTESPADKASRLMVVEIDADGKAGTPHPLHDSPSAELQGAISPDGRWIAYTSFESGSPEVYVHAYPTGGAKTRISAEGGQRPRWSRDGKELYFWGGTPATRFHAVDIPNGDASRAGTPKKLFEFLAGTTWDVTADKNKFLVELTTTRDGVDFAIVTNWFEELKAKAPAKK